MADDIQISADTSQAVKAFQQLNDQFVRTMGTIGASNAQMTKAASSIDRLAASAIGYSVKQQAASQQTSSALKKQADGYDVAQKAAIAYAKAEQQALTAAGISQNSAGKYISASSGRFVSAGAVADAKSGLLSQAQIQAQMTLEARLAAMRATNAANAEIGQRNAANAARETTSAYKAQQAALEKAFNGNNYNILAGDLNKFPSGIRRIVGAFGDLSNSARYALYSVSTSFTIAGAAVLAFGAASLTAAANHEKAFAEVRRTTQTTTAGYAALEKQIELLAQTLPVSYSDLAKIATAAGQLGIQASGVANFTQVVAELTATTSLSADAAGNALARFAAFFSTVNGGKGDQSLAVTANTFTNLASSILKVGVNSISTETGIVNVATQISSMGSYAGLTADQVVGLSGSLSSIAVPPELSRGIITRLFTTMGNAVSTGGVQLQKFATISGESSSQFASSWGTQNFGDTLVKFFNGLKNSGGDANEVLKQLGITSVRDVPVLLRLASAAGESGKAGTLLAQNLNDARSGWQDNTELAYQYGIVSGTTSAKLQVLGQAFEQMFANMGSQGNTALGQFAGFLTDIVRSANTFLSTDVGKTFSTVGVTATLAAGGLLLLVGAGARVVASIQGVQTALSSLAAEGGNALVGLERVGAGFRIVSGAIAAAGLVAAIASVIGVIISLASAANEAKNPITDMSGFLAAMQQDAEAGANGLAFYSDSLDAIGKTSGDARAKAEDMATALGTTGGQGVNAATGINAAAESAKKLKYVFGDTAKAIYNQQLLQNADFQKLFDPSSYSFAKAKYFNPVQLDWEAIKAESLKKGGDVAKLVREQIVKQTGEGISENAIRAGAENYASKASAFADTVAHTLGGLGSAIQGQINAVQALSVQTGVSIGDMIDDYTKLDDVQQKTVEAAGQGLAKFADQQTLINLTQTAQKGNAKDFEDAWAQAYGGTAINIKTYLDVFQRAADTQSEFNLNLQQLQQKNVPAAIISDLQQLGPAAFQLAQSLVTATAPQLQQFVDLYGKTGFDSQVKFATQAQIAQGLVNNIMATGGLNALRAFNNALSSGVGVDAALKSLQRDVNGNPIAVTPVVHDDALQSWKIRVGNQAVPVPVTPYLTKTHIQTDPLQMGAAGGNSGMRMWASGGYTGSGGKYDPAGVVHKGEFVMTKEATSRIGAANLYAMMYSAQGGRSAPSSRGYAGGGYVGGGITVVELSAYDRSLLAAAGDVRLYLDGKQVAQATSGANFTATQRGQN